MAQQPRKGPGASATNAKRHPVCSARSGSPQIVTSVSPKPRLVCSVSAVPMYAGSASSVTAAENCAESATTLAPQTRPKAISTQAGPA